MKCSGLQVQSSASCEAIRHEAISEVLKLTSKLEELRELGAQKIRTRRGLRTEEQNIQTVQVKAELAATAQKQGSSEAAFAAELRHMEQQLGGLARSNEASYTEAKEWSHAVQAVQQDLKALAEEKEQLKEDGSDGRQISAEQAERQLLSKQLLRQQGEAASLKTEQELRELRELRQLPPQLETLRRALGVELSTLAERLSRGFEAQDVASAARQAALDGLQRLQHEQQSLFSSQEVELQEVTKAITNITRLSRESELQAANQAQLRHRLDDLFGKSLPMMQTCQEEIFESKVALKALQAEVSSAYEEDLQQARMSAERALKRLEELELRLEESGKRQDRTAEELQAAQWAWSTDKVRRAWCTERRFPMLKASSGADLRKRLETELAGAQAALRERLSQVLERLPQLETLLKDHDQQLEVVHGRQAEEVKMTKVLQAEMQRCSEDVSEALSRTEELAGRLVEESGDHGSLVEQNKTQAQELFNHFLEVRHQVEDVHGLELFHLLGDPSLPQHFDPSRSVVDLSPERSVPSFFAFQVHLARQPSDDTLPRPVPSAPAVSFDISTPLQAPSRDPLSDAIGSLQPLAVPQDGDWGTGAGLS
eukprot:g16474.t1